MENVKERIINIDRIKQDFSLFMPEGLEYSLKVTLKEDLLRAAQIVLLVSKKTPLIGAMVFNVLVQNLKERFPSLKYFTYTNPFIISDSEKQSLILGPFIVVEDNVGTFEEIISGFLNEFDRATK